MQEEPLNSPRATPELLLASFVAVHHRNRQGPSSAQEGYVRKCDARRQAQGLGIQVLDTPYEYDNIRSAKAQLHWLNYSNKMTRTHASLLPSNVT